MNEQIEEVVRTAMRRAYNLGQTYWQQADSEYTSQHKKADVTAGRFIELIDETCASVGSAIASQAPRKALSDSAIIGIASDLPRGGWHTCGDIVKFARKIEAASGPNAALVEALRNYVDGCSTVVDANAVARAALAAVGEGE